MVSSLHAAILATVLAATTAVGIASAAIYMGGSSGGSSASPRADRLPVVAAVDGYVTVETRHDGVSILQRIQLNQLCIAREAKPKSCP